MKLAAKESIRWIALSSLIVGTLDGVGAIVVYNANPIKLFQYVASGALGREIAFGGGISTFLVGVAFHYFIATCWTILFFVLYDKINLIRKLKLASGFFYGLFIWAVMNLAVVKFSRINGATPGLEQMWIGAAILIVAIGFPLAYLADRFHRKNDLQRVNAPQA